MRFTAMTGAVAFATALAACSGGTDTANDTETDAIYGNEPVNGMAAGNMMMAGGTAVAMLKTADGADAGTATVTGADGGLHVTVNATGLPEGTHGVHIHMTGQCEGPTFASAGGHWNPTDAHHGVDNLESPKPHMGDLPNMEVGGDGTGALDATIEGATMAGLMDADGAAFVVHAKADDLKSDPSGNSGDRIACGVFTAQ
jgi:Cu-Zn family superoxide dismutase